MKRRHLFLVTVLCILMCALTHTSTAQRRYSSVHVDRGRYSRVPVFYPKSYRSSVYARPAIIPGGSISLFFGGTPYYYNRGCFYRSFGTSIRMVVPPVGIIIRALPPGYRQLSVGASLYYFYNDVYYRRIDDRQYTVVDPPKGAELASLPHDAKAVVLNGEKFYESNGVFYKEKITDNGSLTYLVVGKHGEVDNTIADVKERSAKNPEIGDIVESLPDGCKTVVVNGEKLFVAADDTYYAEMISGSQMRYKIVGKSSGNASR